ncbi:hypothetical protein DFH08DRAFT_826990 [Mycena albidolilacea]|uniref:Uncharacterized protein n=1 Tax=Mycena albidolilacea TaxID=1033008 RepID=A0AAD7E7K4_9AGAR|nr:hypothetical protein DFH08DRAFT_826990 [Mycena albidolilacea]
MCKNAVKSVTRFEIKLTWYQSPWSEAITSCPLCEGLVVNFKTKVLKFTIPDVLFSVTVTSDSGLASRLGEVDSSRVESSHAHDSDRLLSRTQVDLSRLESLESTLVYREMNPREFELVVHLSTSRLPSDPSVARPDRKQQQKKKHINLFFFARESFRRGRGRHRDNHERRGISRRACRLPGCPGRALLEFSGVIIIVNDAPDQSGVVVFGLEVHYFWITICWYHIIVGELHQAQELGFFDSEATIQPDGTSIVLELFGRNGGPMAVTTVSRADQRVRFLPNHERTITGNRHIIRTPFRAKGGEDWFQVSNETTLGLYSFRLVVDQKCPPQATPIAKSGALPKTQKVKMVKGDE